MTGYGWQEVEIAGALLSIEIKAVNHRYREISIRAPRAFHQFEEAIRKCVSKRISRGRIDVTIQLSANALMNKMIRIDWTLADAYYQALREMKTRYHLEGGISLSNMLQLPDVLVLEERQETAPFQAPLLNAIDEALKQLVAMREREGEVILQDIAERNQMIKRTIEEIETFAPQINITYQERLKDRLEAFLAQKVEVDESRLLNEVAVMAEKADISEECTRLKSHCQQFEQFLGSVEPVGRKLDFLVQEMLREINTIGAKTQSIKISQRVVDLKSELEKIREQIQNVE